MPTGAAVVGPVPLRRLTVEDWVAYREIRLRSLAADPVAFEATLDVERTYEAERWRARLGRSTAVTWAALGPEGRFVGTIVAEHLEPRSYVFGMWVEPSHRGHGVGGRLLDAAIEWLGSAAPGGSVYLDVNPRQEPAVRLYRSRRFLETGRSKLLAHTPGERAIEMVRTAGP